MFARLLFSTPFWEMFAVISRMEILPKQKHTRAPPRPQPFCQSVCLYTHDCLVGLVAKASTSRAEDPGSNPACTEIFPGSVIPMTSARCQCSVIRWDGMFVLQLQISVWQHVKLSEQIRPWDTLECCWDVKQPTNNYTQPLTQIWMHVYIHG